MTKTISLINQKGGVSKTTSCAIMARLLADEGNKVLCVDFDTQGSLTIVLTGHSPNEFTNNTILEAIQENNAIEHTMILEDNIDYIAANKFLSLLEHQKFTYNPLESLKRTLDKVKSEYDYILIDSPPAMGHLSLCALVASDYCIIPTESSKLSYMAIDEVLETIYEVKEDYNNDLKVLGILRTLADSRRNDNKYYVSKIKETYPDLTLDTIIKRTATVGRLPDKGITNNDEIKEVVRQHKEFLQELRENGL